MAQRPTESPARRYPVLSFVSPDVADIAFYEYRDSRMRQNSSFSYGQPHENSAEFPHHTLGLVVPAEMLGDGMQKWYFVCDRANQDAYNYEFNGQGEMIRTYVIPRGNYHARHEDDPEVEEGEFTWPTPGVDSRDEAFPMFAFADDTLRRSEEPFDSLYVTIQRRLVEPLVVELVYDERLGRNIQVTKEIVPVGFAEDAPASEPGFIRETKHGNPFHDVLITQELLNQTFPYELPALPDYEDKQFPLLLTKADVLYAWAVAASPEAAPSYSEDYTVDYKTVSPRPGPYEVTVERWVTDDPDAIRLANPMTEIPSPVRETVNVQRYWYDAGKQGNRTFAAVEGWDPPASIHPIITVNFDGTGDEGETEQGDGARTLSLAATPGYHDFADIVNGPTPEIIAGFKPLQLPLGLYEVRVIKMNVANLYRQTMPDDPTP